MNRELREFLDGMESRIVEKVESRVVERVG